MLNNFWTLFYLDLLKHRQKKEEKKAKGEKAKGTSASYFFPLSLLKNNSCSLQISMGERAAFFSREFPLNSHTTISPTTACCSLTHTNLLNIFYLCTHGLVLLLVPQHHCRHSSGSDENRKGHVSLVSLPPQLPTPHWPISVCAFANKHAKERGSRMKRETAISLTGLSPQLRLVFPVQAPFQQWCLQKMERRSFVLLAAAAVVSLQYQQNIPLL